MPFASLHKRRTTTNLKTKNNQNCQKTELYGSPTTKEIKKKHSPRPVGGAEPGSWAERTHSKAAAGRPSEVADCGAGWAKLQLAARQQLVDQATDLTSQGSSTGK